MQRFIALLFVVDCRFCVADEDSFLESQSIDVVVAGEDLVVEIGCTFLEVFVDG